MTNDTIPIKKRFIEVREALNKTQAELAKIIRVDKSAISKIESEKEIKRIPTLKVLVAMEQEFNINRNYITDGIGPMFNTGIKPRLEAIPKFVYPDPEIFKGNDHKYAYSDDGPIAMRVKIVPAKAQLGYFRSFGDPEYMDEFDFEIIDVDKEHFGNYNGFETTGWSMVNLTSDEWVLKSILPGKYAIGRELDRYHWKSKLHMHKNDAWIIVHRTEGVILKEIISHDVSNGLIKVHSWNPDKETYPDEELFLGDIGQLFNVVKIIDRRR